MRRSLKSTVEVTLRLEAALSVKDWRHWSDMTKVF
jgi:hypothetical protein